MIAEGTHAAVCRAIQFNQTNQNPPKPQVVIGFELVGDEDPDRGWFISYFGGLDDAQEGKKHGSYDFTIQALRNIGWKGDELADLPDLAGSGQLAEVVWLVVEHEEYDGQRRAKVKFVNRPGGGAIQLKRPMSEADVKILSAQMKQRLKADAAKRGSTTTSNQQRTTRSSAPQNSQHPNAPGYDRDAPPPGDDW